MKRTSLSACSATEEEARELRAPPRVDLLRDLTIKTLEKRHGRKKVSAPTGSSSASSSSSTSTSSSSLSLLFDLRDFLAFLRGVAAALRPLPAHSPSSPSSSPVSPPAAGSLRAFFAFGVDGFFAAGVAAGVSLQRTTDQNSANRKLKTLAHLAAPPPASSRSSFSRSRSSESESDTRSPIRLRDISN